MKRFKAFINEIFDHETHINNLKNSAHDEGEYNKHLSNLRAAKPSKADLSKVYHGVTGFKFSNFSKEQTHAALEKHGKSEQRHTNRAAISREKMPI